MGIVIIFIREKSKVRCELRTLILDGMEWISHRPVETQTVLTLIMNQNPTEEDSPLNQRHRGSGGTSAALVLLSRQSFWPNWD